MDKSPGFKTRGKTTTNNEKRVRKERFGNPQAQDGFSKL